MVLGPFAPQQRLRPSGRAKQQAWLPGRNPAFLEHVNNFPFISRNEAQASSSEQQGKFLGMAIIAIV